MQTPTLGTGRGVRWKSYHPCLRKKGGPSALGVRHPDSQQRAVNADRTGCCPHARPSLRDSRLGGLHSTILHLPRSLVPQAPTATAPCPPGPPRLGPEFQPPCTSAPGPSFVPSLKVSGVPGRPPLPACAPQTDCHPVPRRQTATPPSHNPTKSRRWQASDFRLAANTLTPPDSEP